jgi:hypothetical protein
VTTPADIARAYVEAFGRGDDIAHYLADTVTFESPRGKLEGVTNVAKAINEFTSVVTAVNILSVSGDDTQAMIMYDMETAPFGILRAVDHLVIHDEKIIADQLVFDTRKLRGPSTTDASVITYQTKPEAADENQALVEKVFSQLHDERPEGLHYQTFRLADGVSYMHIVQGDSAALTQLSAFTAFQEGISNRVATPPTRTQATQIGTYGQEA